MVVIVDITLPPFLHSLLTRGKDTGCGGFSWDLEGFGA